jgi:imidazolonepropionase-like amidohydrolase
MATAVTLRSPDGTVVSRGIDRGLWVDPGRVAATTVGEDLWALPGLVDAHSHIGAAELNYRPGELEGAMARAREALAAGVTLLLDKGWLDDTAIQVADLVPEGERPDIEAARHLLSTPDGYFPGAAREIEAGELLAVAEEEAAAGLGWVKLIGDWPRKGMGPVANFTEDQMRAVVRAADGVGARVAIHTMARDAPAMAVAAGVHSIEHGLFLDDDDIEALGERGGMWVPTFLRVEALVAQLGSESSGGRLLAEGLANASRLLPKAVEAGVRVLAGTDLIGTPANVAAEALKMGDYGLNAEQLVEAVSVSGLRATGRPAAFEIGTPADAVLFPANPVVEPSVMAHPRMVIRKGRVL